MESKNNTRRSSSHNKYRPDISKKAAALLAVGLPDDAYADDNLSHSLDQHNAVPTTDENHDQTTSNSYKSTISEQDTQKHGATTDHPTQNTNAYKQIVLYVRDKQSQDGNDSYSQKTDSQTHSSYKPIILYVHKQQSQQSDAAAHDDRGIASHAQKTNSHAHEAYKQVILYVRTQQSQENDTTPSDDPEQTVNATVHDVYKPIVLYVRTQPTNNHYDQKISVRTHDSSTTHIANEQIDQEAVKDENIAPQDDAQHDNIDNESQDSDDYCVLVRVNSMLLPYVVEADDISEGDDVLVRVNSMLLGHFIENDDASDDGDDVQVELLYSFDSMLLGEPIPCAA